MNVIICGDRNWTDYNTIHIFLNYLLPRDTLIIHGDCRGADKIAGHIATCLGLEVKACPAEWNKHGKGAGPIRNERMIVDYKPDLVVAFHNNIAESKGTTNMLNQAKRHEIPTLLIQSTNQ